MPLRSSATASRTTITIAILNRVPREPALGGGEDAAAQTRSDDEQDDRDEQRQQRDKREEQPLHRVPAVDGSVSEIVFSAIGMKAPGLASSGACARRPRSAGDEATLPI